MNTVERLVQKNNYKIRSKGLVLSLVVFIMLVFSSSSVFGQSQTIGFHIEYDIVFGELVIGKSTRRMEYAEDGFYYMKHEVVPGKLAGLFGEKSYTQMSKFSYEQMQIIPSEFRVTRQSDSESSGARFDWDNLKIEFYNGDTVDMPEHEILDFESWYISLMIAPKENLSQQLLTIVERNKVRTYRYQRPEPEVLEFGGESVNTIKIKMRDVNDSRRGFTVWVLRDSIPIPIRVDRHKKSQTFSFLVTSFNWI